jgi:hypothetical protein
MHIVDITCKVLAMSGEPIEGPRVKTNGYITDKDLGIPEGGVD